MLLKVTLLHMLRVLCILSPHPLQDMGPKQSYTLLQLMNNIFVPNLCKFAV
jgi:hypothetical protein